MKRHLVPPPQEYPCVPEERRAEITENTECPEQWDPAPFPPGTQCGGSPLTTAQLNPPHTCTLYTENTHISTWNDLLPSLIWMCWRNANEPQLAADRQREADGQTSRQTVAQQRGGRKREQRSSPG